MASTWRPRYYGESEENRVERPFRGKVRLLSVALNYGGTESPLNCTVDSDRLCEFARNSGVKDIVQVHDDGSTEKFPSKDELKEEILAFASRCKKRDCFVMLYSGHGDNQENEESNSGFDSLLCLRTRDGEDETMVDDELAALISEKFHPSVQVLILADACHSGNVLDCDTPGIWSGRKVCAISGCQDTQCSIDTGDGGAMTNALLQVLGQKKIKKLRRKRAVSIQFIFNRMVQVMPDDDEDEDEEDDEDDEEEGDEDEDDDEEEDDEDGEDDVDPITGEEPEPGQNINLSWPGGCDPSKMAFPF